MVVRIVLFLLGAASGGGGGYLAWLNRASAQSLFPMDPQHAPWMLIGGMAGVAIGVVLLAAAVAPRSKTKAAKAAEKARRDAAIKEADSFYSSRAKSPQAAQNRAADRDWRSGDIPPPPPPRPAAQPQPQAQPQPAPRAASPIPPPIPPQAPPKPQPTMQAAPPPQPAPRPAPAPELVTPARPAAVKPQASGAPPVNAAATPFPAQSTLSPMPRASDPPAQTPQARPAPAPPLQTVPPVQATPAARPAAAAPSGNAAFDRIRALIGQNKLDEADKILGEERERLTKAGDTEKVGLAELTALAGDHAAAAGRTSNAKWLWRLALKRFQEAEAMSAPAAKAVSERLRLADQ